MKNFNETKWAFTCGNFNAKRGPLWTTSSPAVYPSKGAALFFAYNECLKHGCPPKGVHVSTDEYKNGAKLNKHSLGSLDYAL
jgi:hypothetical protein